MSCQFLTAPTEHVKRIHMDAQKRPVALFDFDGTLFRGDSIAPFLLFLLRKKPMTIVFFLRLSLLVIPYAFKLIDKKTMKNEVLRIWSHVAKSQQEPLLKEFHDRILLPRCYSDGIERVRWHQNQGHLLVLASASMDFYLQTIQKSLGFDLLICTQTSSAAIPQVVGANCYGEEKINRINQLDFFQHTDWSASFAYSDHHSDLPMLKLCGHPVATTPNRKLRQLAQDQGWEVVDWG